MAYETLSSERPLKRVIDMVELSSPESTRSSSPESENPNIEIVVDNVAFTFEKQYLRARCGYFDETYPHSSCPEFFWVAKQGDTHQLEPNPAYTSRAFRNDVVVRPRAALPVFANFFGLICQDREWNLTSGILLPEFVALMADLATKMKCCTSVKATIMGFARMSAENFEVRHVNACICDTLETTYFLQNEQYFNQTMQHVIALKPYLEMSLKHLPIIVQYILEIEHKRFQKTLVQTFGNVQKELDTILQAAFMDEMHSYRRLFSRFRNMLHDCLNPSTDEIDNIKASKTLKFLRESMDMGIFDGMRNSEEGGTMVLQLSTALPDVAAFHHQFGLTYLAPPRPDIEPPWKFQ